MTQSTTSTPKTVLITGCSAGGIGSALAETFNERGLHVFATARSLSKMTHLENRPGITLLELDVTSSSSIHAAVEAVTAITGGRLDYLVNNSGQSCVRPALDTDLQRARELFDVNFWGKIEMVHAFSPLVIASKGSIVNMGSIAAVVNPIWGAFYNSAKAAVQTYDECLRLELAPLGVKVVTIMTGIVRTNIFVNHPDPKLPKGSPWQPAYKEMEELVAGKLNEDAMSTSEFSKRVVNDVLGGSTGLTWRGKLGSIAWFMHAYLPSWLLDRVRAAGSGIERLPVA